MLGIGITSDSINSCSSQTTSFLQQSRAFASQNNKALLLETPQNTFLLTIISLGFESFKFYIDLPSLQNHDSTHNAIRRLFPSSRSTAVTELAELIGETNSQNSSFERVSAFRMIKNCVSRRIRRLKRKVKWKFRRRRSKSKSQDVFPKVPAQIVYDANEGDVVERVSVLSAMDMVLIFAVSVIAVALPIVFRFMDEDSFVALSVRVLVILYSVVTAGCLLKYWLDLAAAKLPSFKPLVEEKYKPWPLADSTNSAFYFPNDYVHAGFYPAEY